MWRCTHSCLVTFSIECDEKRYNLKTYGYNNSVLPLTESGLVSCLLTPVDSCYGRHGAIGPAEPGVLSLTLGLRRSLITKAISFYILI